MPQIKAITDEMHERASIIGTEAEGILASQTSVTGIFRNMGKDFSGAIPSLMLEHMIAMQVVYRGMNESLNGYKNFLDDTANNYEWTDGEASRWFQTLNN